MNRSIYLLLTSLTLLAAACTAPKETPDFTQYVNTAIGSGGHGHVFVGASVPFGMVQLGSTSVTQGWDWCSGYHISDSTIFGFSHLHLQGTGIGDLCDINVMPVTGPVRYARGSVDDPASGHWCYGLRSQEVNRPGFYAIPLANGVQVELTATERVGLHRYTFPAGGDAALLFDLENAGNYERTTDAGFTREGDAAISGWRFSSGWAKNQKIFFYAEFSEKIGSYQTDVPEAGGDIPMYARLGFDALKDGGQVLVKVALSPVSVEGAKANMAAELPGWDFDATVRSAQAKWNRELGKVRVETPDADDKTIFYTALYHLMVHPSLFCDVDGSYRGADDRIHRGEGFNNYTVFSLWDTYRAAVPLMNILFPERVNDMANTFLGIYRQQGKLPVWHLMANETDCMVGNPGVIALADVMVKGYDGFDKDLAYEALKNSAMRPDRGQDFRMQYGYLPADCYNRSVAVDMEYAIADAAVAHVAAQLGKTEDAAYFTERSHSYRHFFDPETLFIRGKNSDGSWVEPFNPYLSNHGRSVYCEGNAWQYTWLVPQDLEGLCELYGSKEKMLSRLDSLFAAKEEVEGEEKSPDISGMIGQYAHGNEPSHHILYLYAMAGEPAKTAEKVHLVLKNLYLNDPDGLSGNEDAGEMSAWYIISSLGFYQVEPASTRYWFGTPLFDLAEVKVPGGTFRITAEDRSEENIYIQSVSLNGMPLTRGYIDFKEIYRGGELVFKMGAEPKKWY